MAKAWIIVWNNVCKTASAGRFKYVTWQNANFAGRTSIEHPQHFKAKKDARISCLANNIPRYNINFQNILFIMIYKRGLPLCQRFIAARRTMTRTCKLSQIRIWKLYVHHQRNIAYTSSNPYSFRKTESGFVRMRAHMQERRGKS